MHQDRLAIDIRQVLHNLPARAHPREHLPRSKPYAVTLRLPETIGVPEVWLPLRFRESASESRHRPNRSDPVVLLLSSQDLGVRRAVTWLAPPSPCNGYHAPQPSGECHIRTIAALFALCLICTAWALLAPLRRCPGHSRRLTEVAGRAKGLDRYQIHSGT